MAKLAMTERLFADLAVELHRDEDSIPHAYQDHLGYWTIGVGRLIDKRKGGGLSPDEIDYLLKNDIQKRYKALSSLLPWFNGLTDGRKRALLNMAFQLGIDGLLGFKNTLAYVAKGEYKLAAVNAKKSLWYKQTPARAQRVLDLLVNG